MFPKNNLGHFDVLYNDKFAYKILIEFHSSELLAVQGQIMLIRHLWLFLSSGRELLWVTCVGLSVGLSVGLFVGLSVGLSVGVSKKNVSRIAEG